MFFFFLAGVRKSRLASAPRGPGAVPRARSVLSPGGEQLGFGRSLLRVGSSSLQAFTFHKLQPQSHTPAPTSHRKPQGPCKARRGGGCVPGLWDPSGVSLPGFPGLEEAQSIPAGCSAACLPLYVPAAASDLRSTSRREITAPTSSISIASPSPSH